MQTLTVVHLEKFQAKLVEIETAYNLSGRNNFDVAYYNNLAEDKTFNEVSFKVELEVLKEKSKEKEETLLSQMGALKEAIKEAKRQIELAVHIKTALDLINL